MIRRDVGENVHDVLDASGIEDGWLYLSPPYRVTSAYATIRSGLESELMTSPALSKLQQ